MPFDPAAQPPLPAGTATEMDATDTGLADMAELAELTAVTRLLTEPLAQSESAFVTVGGALGTAIDLLGQLTTRFAELPRDLEHEDLNRATRQLAAVAGEVSAMAGALAQEHQAFDRLCTLAGDVSSRIARLRKTVSVINVLAINARIAATHIRGTDDDFSVFTNEIGRLGRAATATIDRFDENFERLAALIRSARDDQATFVKRERDTLLSVARRLEEGLSTVATRRSRAAAAAAQIGDRSQEIARGIGAAIGALQIGDITRQRLEHVGHAVDVLARGLDTATAGSADHRWLSSLPTDRRRLAVGVVCRLQAAQTSAAADALVHETQQVTVALEAMAKDARAIVGLGIDVYGADQPQNYPHRLEEPGGASFLGDLVTSIKEADTLIKACTAARQDVDRVVTAVSATLTDLVGQVQAVQAVEIDMRLVGLNTALKCGRLGDQGRTLSVIAQELRTYANLTVDDARGVGDGLRAVAAAAAALDPQEKAGGAAHIAILEHETADSIAKLETVGDRLTGAVDALTRNGAQVVALLEETIINTAACDRIAGLMREVQAHLTGAANANGGTADGLAEIRAHVLPLIHGRYTMACERDIHDLFSDAAAPPPAAGQRSAPAAAQNAATLDDILF